MALKLFKFLEQNMIDSFLIKLNHFEKLEVNHVFRGLYISAVR